MNAVLDRTRKLDREARERKIEPSETRMLFNPFLIKMTSDARTPHLKARDRHLPTQTDSLSVGYSRCYGLARLEREETETAIGIRASN